MFDSPKGPYKLVTVNTAPDRAKRLIGRMVEGLKDHYEVKHVANCSSKLCLNHRRSLLILRSY